MRRRALSIAVTVAMALTSMGASTAVAAPPSTEDLRNLAVQTLTQNNDVTPTADETAAVNGWTLDANTAAGTLEAGTGDWAGWTHLQAGSSAGNQAGDKTQYPTVAVSSTTVDLTKAGSYEATVKSPQEGALNRFGFYLGYTDPGSGLFIGYDKDGWFWQTYTGGGSGSWYQGTRVAAPAANAETTVKITWTDAKVATLTVNGAKAFDVDYSAMTNLTNKLAVKAGGYQSEYTNVYIKDASTAPVVKYTVSGTVKGKNNAALKGASVTVGDQSVTTDDKGAYTLKDLADGTYTITVSADGYDDATKTVTVKGGNLTGQDVTLNETAPVATVDLKTADMTVAIKKNFPSVLQYTMTKLDGKIMYGQPKDVRTVAINGTNLTLKDSDVKFTKNSDTKATYELTLKDTAKKIDAVLTVEITVKANQLHMNVTKVVNNIAKKNGNVEENAIQTIAFPNQSLISVRSNQDAAQFTGARMSSDTTKVGDTNYDVTDKTTSNEEDYTYGFISGGGLSAGLWSNSEHDGKFIAAVNGGAKNTRVLANTQKVGSATSLGLGTAPYYYHRTVTDTKGRSYTVEQTDMPKMAVAIAGDANDDKAVNWEDGAIAYRDIMNNPYKSEEVPELVAWRIAMNFGSQAQNPFLTTLDNVKKVALNTDGLGQSVLLKGYGNEGHDSGHPDYGDIGQRIGGAADMNTLMDGAAEYGARIGIHVNASEMYPEAKAFSEDMVNRNAQGGLNYGWNWLDQAIGIDGIYDLASNSRKSRFAELKKEVGDKMDFIYLDVWGNNTSGAEDSWETRKMSQMINQNGWRMTTEWGTGNEYDATFQHWAADLTYGGAGMKGENSQVMRFLRNHQKDSWVGDYPSYGQAANSPLLGGYNMKDFEGWQGRNDYAAYITNLYTHDVSTKFIQHFKVTQWVNSPLDATSVKDASVNGGNEQITLKDSYGNVVVLKRGSNDVNDAAYRERTITFNGVTVASGKVSRGDNGKDGTESYLLPWLWDVNTGKLVESANEKLYHWNTLGGTTEWTLPESWRNLASVKVYELNDQGKTNERTVAVKDGKVSLEAAAQTPYVVTKGAERQLKVTWSTGMHATDVGFNDAKTLGENWLVSTGKNGKAEVVGTNNAMLKLTGDAKVSQKLTDLKAGQRYAVYLGVDNRSDTDAVLSVTSNGKTLATNSTGKSIAKNYVKAYAHNTNSDTEGGSSYFQNMYVWFEAPKDGSDVTVVLSHKGDSVSGHAYFDDVRVLENGYNGLTLNADGTLKTLTNDFENNAQGIWPFVIGGIEGVEDNRTHLSELHAPFTQADWDVKKMDDVLDGTWSLKTNGLSGYNKLVYQTIPQNVKLEPGETYKVTFKYQAGSHDIYAFAVGDGEFNGSNVKLTNIKKAMGKDADGTFTATVTGSVTGDSWFGIYSTTTAADLQGTRGAAANFGGYKDFILDDLKVERVAPTTTHTKAEAEAKLKEVKDAYEGKSESFSADAWAVYTKQVAAIEALVTKDGATADDYTKAYNLAVALATYMTTAPNNDSSDAWDVATNAYTASSGSAQTNYGNYEGPTEFAQDGKTGTYWHTAWGVNAISAGTAWYQFDLGKATTITGLRYLPRPNQGDAVNGKIKQYVITVTKADGTTQDIEGEFTTANVWQKVTFDKPIENVTKVRLTAKSSTGSSADQANQFASAAELRLTSDTKKEPDTPEPTEVNAKALEEAIAAAKKLKEGDYTAASWGRMTAQLAEAEKVLKDAKDLGQNPVDTMAAALTNAIDALVTKDQEPPTPTIPNTSELEAAIGKAAAITKGNYTDDSWNKLVKALDNARKVLASAKAGNADQAAVDKAAKDLNAAISGLKTNNTTPVEPNKPATKEQIEALDKAINGTSGLKQNAYTAASWKAYAEALAKAKQVLADAKAGKATQQQVADATAALRKAIAGLKAAPTGDTGDKKPGSDDKPINKKPGVADTGASILAAGVACMALAGVAGVLMASRRRSSKE